MPPPGPPRDNQSSIRTTQPTPIIVPKPKVKYSTALRRPWSWEVVDGRVEGMRGRTICQMVGLGAEGSGKWSMTRHEPSAMTYSAAHDPSATPLFQVAA